jgi:hypothetical protein
LQVEEMGRVDSGIQAREHDCGEAGADGEVAVGEALAEPAVSFEQLWKVGHVLLPFE